MAAFDTLIYAKSTKQFRQTLWENLQTLFVKISTLCIIAGDFNSDTDPVEQKCGRVHNISRSLSFIDCIVDCNFTDIGFNDFFCT